MKFVFFILSRFARQNLLRAMIVLTLVAGTLGCSKKPELVGNWENTNVQELIEIKPDNSGIIQGKNLPPLLFVWQEIAEHSYNLDVNFQGQMKKLKGVVKDNTLVLEGDGGKETYRKLPSK